jgi:hypothetical protein
MNVGNEQIARERVIEKEDTPKHYRTGQQHRLAWCRLPFPLRFHHRRRKPFRWYRRNLFDEFRTEIESICQQDHRSTVSILGHNAKRYTDPA